jgi:Uma2 family endonuclease
MRTATQTHTLAEYTDLEYTAETRHEYINGEVGAMANTSPNHARIVRNLTLALSKCADEMGCELFAETRLVWSEACERAYYPDVLIVCGEMEVKALSKNMVATLNPRIIIEVASPSPSRGGEEKDATRDYDKTEKWRCYKKIPSLEQYFLIEQDFKYIELRERFDEQKWTISDFENDNELLSFGNCATLLKDIYNKVVFDNHVSDNAPNV